MYSLLMRVTCVPLYVNLSRIEYRNNQIRIYFFRLIQSLLQQSLFGLGFIHFNEKAGRLNDIMQLGYKKKKLQEFKIKN